MPKKSTLRMPQRSAAAISKQRDPKQAAPRAPSNAELAKRAQILKKKKK